MPSVCGMHRAFVVLITGAVLLVTTILPFALAGLTGNVLWIAAPVALTLVYILLREAPRCLLYYRSLWPRAWLPALLWAGAALATTVGIGALLSAAPSN